jgi:hypothetical protein
VDALLAELTSPQIAEWMAYFQLEPFGERRADLRAGIIASTVANAHRAKDSRPYKPQDFMPDFESGRTEDDAADLLAKAQAALGGGAANA